MEENEKPKGQAIKGNGCVVVNFAIKDCPLWLYKWFNDNPSRYNDIYWVRLKEIHDYIVFSQPIEEKKPEMILTPENPAMEKKAKDYVVRTFGGSERVKMEEKENE